MFNLNHFYYFYTVAETGSVTAASKALRVSQPALSKQIKVFENSINTKLFEKKGRGLRLTPVGLSLYGQARVIFEKAAYLSREFESAPKLESEHIRIGLSASIERSFASEVIGEFFKLSLNKVDKKHSLSISTLDGDFVGRYLREHVVDACITAQRISGANIFEAASIISPICLIAPAQFARRLRGVKREDFRASVVALDLPWIVPSADLRFRFEVESILEKNNLDLRYIIESDSMMTIVRSVENGVGLALVPRQYCMVARDPRQLIILDRLRAIPNVSLSLWVRNAEKDKAFVRQLVTAFEKSGHF